MWRFVVIILCLSISFSSMSFLHYNIASTEYSSISFQKGFSYAAWWNDTYMTNESDKSLENLHSLGVEWVSIITTWYQDDEESTEIMPDKDSTPSDESIVHVISRAHSLGMKVMIKPHVDLYNGKWRGEIEFKNERDWREWFRSYKNFICHYAKLAEQNNVEQFCVGCELVKTVKRTEWFDVINAVRENFSGTITYAADWSNYQNVTFWNELDFVGIDAYFPLTDKNDSSLEELMDAWKRWKREIEEFSNITGKDIVFTEIGYRSIDGCNRDPWNWWREGNIDLEEQMKCYESAFKSFFGESWFKGFFWWMWYPNTSIGGIDDDSYTPFKKPAENVVMSYYKSGGGSLYVSIDKPKQGYLYIFDRKILPVGRTIILGRITVTAVVCCANEVERVEFYVGDNLKFVDFESPYQWVWEEPSLGWYEIKVVAYDEHEESEDHLTIFAMII